MASDEIVWQVMNQQFCSFKLRLDNKTQNFCRNEYNLTGFCNRQSCPLANSRYATVRSDPLTNALYLFIKTPERAHLPSQWWEKIRLPNNYEKALAVIDEKLLYWNKFTLHKCKQRLTRLTQVAVRARRIAREEERLGEKLVPKLASKVKRREDTREKKAESAAKVERAIERELIDRLRSGAYNTETVPVNVEEAVWKKVLRGLERAEKGEDVEFDDEEEYEEEEMEAEVEYVSDLAESEAEEMEDFDDWLGDESEDIDDDDDEDDEDEDEDGRDETDGSADSEEDGESDGDEKAQKPGGKRKRTTHPTKVRKRSAPKVDIEYEYEEPERDVLLAHA